MRLFVAIAVPVEVKENLLKIVHRLKKYNEPIRWINRDNFHFTVKFLGEVAEEKLGMIEKTLEKVASSEQEFRIDITEAGVFPNMLYPHVFWVGNNKCLPFKRICHHLDMELEKLGFTKEKNDAVAHITLGRMKRANSKRVYLMVKGAKDILSQQKLGVKVRKISFMESVLERDGACYKVLKDFNIGGLHG
ncbi:MAG: RNA 2',3'-cyclic phosphodiesterase [Deltaproteobacteria bacterium]|nr:RNA 2',3'-cyclic phosphodiesterase [Deltaproteobacteria bacterium]